jgi:molecular chaperone GrpE
LENQDERKTHLSDVQEDVVRLIKETHGLKDIIKEKNAAFDKEMKNSFLKMLEVADAFDRVFENIKNKEADMNRQMRIWVGNFKSVARLLSIGLKECGVHPIEAPAGKAVPGLHTIVDTKESPGMEADTILEEIEKGYLWHDGILRKAKVIVVKQKT